MAFSREVVAEAWNRCGSRCACTRSAHGHTGRCPQVLRREMRSKEGFGGWEPGRIDPSGSETLSNCQILCQKCHKATLSHGR